MVCPSNSHTRSFLDSFANGKLWGADCEGVYARHKGLHSVVPAGCPAGFTHGFTIRPWCVSVCLSACQCATTFPKINCICKSNTELLGCAKPTAASSVEGRPFAVEANWKCSPAADVSHSVRCVRYWQKSRFLKAIDRLFLVLSCNNTSSFGSLKSCVSVCHLCTGPMSTILALVTPVPPGLLEFVTRI